MRLGKVIKIFRKKKDKKREFCSEWYKNLSEDEKQKLAEYRRNYYVKLKKQGSKSAPKVPVFN